MEFGKIDQNLLDTIDFSLPEDGRYTKGRKTTSKETKLYVGAAKWGRKEWVGLIYPNRTKEADFLDHYVQNFNGIELNTTHYQIYPSTTILKWVDKVQGRDFLFCPKFPQSISHYSDLSSERATGETDRFLSSIVNFGKHLGPLFLQLSERYTSQRKDALYSYLKKLPWDLDITLEVRHPEWFKSGEVRNELFDLLNELSIGVVITDVAGRRDCLHMEITSPIVFIRFVGNGLHPTDYSRIDEWIIRIKSWMKKDLKAIHFYMHQPDELYTPHLVKYMVEQLNLKCGLKLKIPNLMEQSGSLLD